jgi:hypothetical protein
MNSKERAVLIFLLLIAFGFGSYKLTESPQTWIDEGMVSQPALNLERHGVMGLQTSPDNFSSGAYISVGFPVIFPLAGVFSFFGEGLLQARILMLVWILLLVSLSYVYVLKEFGTRTALTTGLLLVTFAPLYGNGKNVLGEVPGLVFFFLFLLLLQRLAKVGFPNRPYMFLGAGLLLGLAVTTKPIFLLVLGAFVFVVVVFGSRTSFWKSDFLKLPLRGSLIFAAGVLLPLIIWFFTQFSVSDSFRDIFSLYRNPYNLENVSSVMLTNFLRFFQELSPLYTVLFFFLWSASIFIRERKKTGEISISERMAFVFSLLVLFFYLRTPGWYRYFFPAQIVILAYLPNSIFSLASYFSWANPQNIRRVITSLLLGLALFQAYQTGFSSWVADHYSSTRTAELTAYFKDWDSEKSIFVYNAPEVIIFFPRDAVYYQFLEVNKGRSIGRAELERISHEPYARAVILSLDEAGQYPTGLFPGYMVKDRINRYVILVSKSDF